MNAWRSGATCEFGKRLVAKRLRECRDLRGADKGFHPRSRTQSVESIAFPFKYCCIEHLVASMVEERSLTGNESTTIIPKIPILRSLKPGFLRSALGNEKNTKS